MAIDISALANAVVENYFDRAVRLTFENRTLFDFPRTPYAEAMGIVDDDYNGPRGILPVKPPTGGISDRLMILESTSHAAEEFTEYAALPDSGDDSWIYAEPTTISCWESILTTGFAQDAAGMSPSDLVDVIAQNMITAFGKLADKINSVALGSTVKGVVGAIDDTTAYGGVDPATYTAWASAVTTVGGVLSRADMDDLAETLESGNRQADPEELPEWWFPRNQITRYQGLAGSMGNAEVPERVAPGGQLNLGYTGFAHGTRPIRNVPGLDSQTILLPYLGRARDQIFIKEVRSLQVVAKPYSGDGDLLAASWRGKLVVRKRHLCGKLETLTA